MNKIDTFNLNDMFGLPKEKELPKESNINDEIKESKIELYISDLVPFRNHPFKLYQGERLDDMIESIKEHGIITPLIVRAIEDGKYEILSGHNRANAGRLAGVEKAPVVIKEDLSDEEAMLIVTETNLIQRSFSELTHSEKARILTERHNAIKNQGKRIDIINEIEMMSNIDGYEENSTLSPLETKLRSDEKVGQKYDLSRANVARYIRIDTLSDELKTRLDNDEIPFRAGVDLSFLKEDEQEMVETILDQYGYKMDLKKSDTLKTMSKGRNLNYDKVLKVLSGEYFEKPKKIKTPKFTSKFTNSIIRKYVTEERSVKEVEEVIENLLEEYFSKN